MHGKKKTTFKKFGGRNEKEKLEHTKFAIHKGGGLKTSHY